MEKKVALVVGGLRGIGKAVSCKLAQSGFITYATSRANVQEISEDILIPLQLDLTCEKDIHKVFEMLDEKHGKLDVLVNNAGISSPGPFENADSNEWDSLFQTNVFGIFSCTQKAFPLLKEQGGRIINISSITTKKPLPQNAIYTASKHALNGLGETLAEEWYPHKVLTTNILLGATYTDLWKGVDAFSPEDMLDVKEVGRIVSFIASTPLSVRIDELILTPPKGVL
ncbi:SDR family oxidoreductase [Priestia abyssalis]|uniref:SDR family oxidoreductase n=1 Tax=Priestia abyssalis TaxID=1221450 RepID=UPI0009951570|nr:SDR family oxidoreductase [Priestia abyssalis]